MRLIPKREMLQMVGAKSYTTVWQWMREGTFPLGLAVGSRTMWRSDEIEQWMAARPRRVVKAPANGGLILSESLPRTVHERE